MTTIFRNPPLVEMIPELRWPTQGQRAVPVVLSGANGSVEAMFLQWIARMGGGYEHVERLVPAGFPLPLDAPALRVKPKTGLPQNTLFQLGPQLFTANATPPYLSWQDLMQPEAHRPGEARFLLDARSSRSSRRTDSCPVLERVAQTIAAKLDAQASKRLKRLATFADGWLQIFTMTEGG